MKFDIELVGKIGSMALIDKKSNILDYTLIARLSSELKPGYIWVTSGAAETGRLDYIGITLLLFSNIFFISLFKLSIRKSKFCSFISYIAVGFLST